MLLLVVDTAGSAGGVLLAQVSENSGGGAHSVDQETEILGVMDLHPRLFSAELIPAVAESIDEVATPQRWPAQPTDEVAKPQGLLVRSTDEVAERQGCLAQPTDDPSQPGVVLSLPGRKLAQPFSLLAPPRR